MRNMRAAAYIGGTTTRLGWSEDHIQIDGLEKFPTPPTFPEAVEKITGLLAGKKIDRLVIGVAGVLDAEKNVLTQSSHLPQWQGQPLRQSLADRLQTTIVVENDAALAALAEARLGAGRNFSSMAYLTIGTGVGGAFVVNGKIQQGAHNIEIGHQIIVAGGRPWSFCGQRGCLEAYVAGSADPAWGRGEFTDEYYQHLSAGVINAVAMWAPAAVVIGGSLSNDIDFDRLARAVIEGFTLFPPPPVIQRALGDEAGLHGGLLYDPPHS